jgi:hypothetical protein
MQQEMIDLKWIIPAPQFPDFHVLSIMILRLIHPLSSYAESAMIEPHKVSKAIIGNQISPSMRKAALIVKCTPSAAPDICKSSLCAHREPAWKDLFATTQRAMPSPSPDRHFLSQRLFFTTPLRYNQFEDSIALDHSRGDANLGRESRVKISDIESIVPDCAEKLASRVPIPCLAGSSRLCGETTHQQDAERRIGQDRIEQAAKMPRIDTN